MAEQDSTQLEWRAEEEAEFWWDGAIWDIEEARAMLAGMPHLIAPFDISRAIRELDSVGIEWDDLDRADLSFPLIVGWLGNEPLVLDGWHRIAKHSKLGLSPFLPAVVLTLEESESIKQTW